MSVRNSDKTLVILIVLIAVAAYYTFGNRSIDISKGDLKNPLKVGTNVWPGYEPLYLARELGFYSEKSIRLVEYSNSTEVLRAFRNGAIHVAALTLDEVLLLWENDFKARAFLLMDISDGGDVIVSSPEFDSIKALKGKRIGAENTALGAYVLSRALQLSGLTTNDVEIVSSKIDEHESMFDDGKFDAVVTFEPIRRHLLAKGAIQVFDSSQIPGEIVDVLVVRDDWIKAFAPKLDTLAKGWFAALDYISSNPDDAHKIIAKRMKISPQEVADSYEGLKLPTLEENIKMLAVKEPGLSKTAEQLYKTMQDTKLLRKKFDLFDLIYKIRLMDSSKKIK
jgi:NitT/TauT family transport system substrate-binding protein